MWRSYRSHNVWRAYKSHIRYNIEVIQGELVMSYGGHVGVTSCGGHTEVTLFGGHIKVI